MREIKNTKELETISGGTRSSIIRTAFKSIRTISTTSVPQKAMLTRVLSFTSDDLANIFTKANINGNAKKTVIENIDKKINNIPPDVTREVGVLHVSNDSIGQIKGLLPGGDHSVYTFICDKNEIDNELSIVRYLISGEENNESVYMQKMPNDAKTTRRTKDIWDRYVSLNPKSNDFVRLTTRLKGVSEWGEIEHILGPELSTSDVFKTKDMPKGFIGWQQPLTWICTDIKPDIIMENSGVVI